MKPANYTGKIIGVFCLAAAFIVAITFGTAFGAPPPTDDSNSILGAHDDGGRGCRMCHTPHTPSLATKPEANAEDQEVALWGQSVSPDYGATLRFGDSDNYVEISPSLGLSASEEIIGVLLCLSCHDGNLTPQNMMSSQSYARKMGLLQNPPLQPIPTFLSDDGLSMGEMSIDHPLGTEATIPLVDGLVFSNGMFSVVPGSPYARFVANYGFPALAPGKRLMPYGINSAGKPYVLCTTCHNQHVMFGYASTATSPIGGDGGGRSYTTYFFANGPYDPGFDTIPGTRAPSTAQFCRQCHFNIANEGNNSHGIRTASF